jgi:hypothetical protein
MLGAYRIGHHQSRLRYTLDEHISPNHQPQMQRYGNHMSSHSCRHPLPHFLLSSRSSEDYLNHLRYSRDEHTCTHHQRHSLRYCNRLRMKGWQKRLERREKGIAYKKNSWTIRAPKKAFQTAFRPKKD